MQIDQLFSWWWIDSFDLTFFTIILHNHFFWFENIIFFLFRSRTHLMCNDVKLSKLFDFFPLRSQIDFDNWQCHLNQEYIGRVHDHFRYQWLAEKFQRNKFRNKMVGKLPVQVIFQSRHFSLYLDQTLSYYKSCH